MTAPALPPDRGWMGDPRRGAALGRASKGEATPAPIKFYLQHVPLDSGGYDSGGSYWGHGGRLYWATTGLTNDDPHQIERFFRAADREAAKAKLRAEFPGARFYR